MTAVEMITREIDVCAIAPETRTTSIVVATDGSDAALAAFRTASLISSRGNTHVHVLSVLEPMPLLFPAAEGMILSPELDQSREQAQRTIVNDQVRQFDAGRQWTLDIAFGRPSEIIVDFAHEQQATLIIIGTNKHGFFGRMMGEETAMEIARLSDVPLLIATQRFDRLPKRVLVAMGLDPDGLQLAPHTLASLVDSPSISCVHVKPRSEFLGVDWADLDSEYETAIQDRFNLLEKNFDSVGFRPELVTLNGDAAREIADFASYSKAELIVVGVRRRQGKSRAVGGRMAAKVLRNAYCSVLIVPSTG